MIELNDKHGYMIDEIERQGHTLFKINNEWVCNDEVAVNQIIATFDVIPSAKADALERIKKEAQEYMQGFDDKYPEYIKRTWPTQRKEIELFDLGQPTPFIDSLAIGRGISRLEMANKIKAKISEDDQRIIHIESAKNSLEQAINDSSDLDYITTATLGL